MEGKESVNSGVTVREYEAPAEGTMFAPRADPPVQPGRPLTVGPAPPVCMVAASTELKKKSGRPRKYGPDGTLAAALWPLPISSSIPLTGGFSGWKQPSVGPFQTVNNTHSSEFESSGNKSAYPIDANDANFTAHVMTVNVGQDIAAKVLSFSQHESRAIVVLYASGSISCVTLQKPTSFGGTLTYEGCFEILSLSGSLQPNENGTMRSRTGGLSVTLSGPKGCVLGGALAGLLIAASPVQVVIGSFWPEHHRAKKQRLGPAVMSPAIPAISSPVDHSSSETGYDGQNADSTSPQTSPRTSTGNVNSWNSTSLRTPTGNVNLWSSTEDSEDAMAENNVSSTPEGGCTEDGGPIQGEENFD